jgi:hypothetical protein
MCLTQLVTSKKSKLEICDIQTPKGADLPNSMMRLFLFSLNEMPQQVEKSAYICHGIDEISSVSENSAV